MVIQHVIAFFVGFLVGSTGFAIYYSIYSNIKPRDIPRKDELKKRTMTEYNKSTLYLILTVMVGFTLVNVIHDNNWVGYVLSLIVFPLITWIFCKIFLKYKLK